MYYANENNDLIRIIKTIERNNKNYRNKAKYYNDTINTKWEDKSSNLVSLILNNKSLKNIFLSTKDQLNNTIWRVSN